MAVLYLFVFGSLVAGIVLALVWWLIRGRKAGRLVGAVSGFTLAAGLLVLLGNLVERMLGASILLPFDVPRALVRSYMDGRFTFSLLLGILGVVLLTFPIRSRRGQGAAELTRRTPMSFLRPRWLVAPGIILALILPITLIAGNISQPDPETGRYMVFMMELGGERAMGTSIYGWFYSIPALILLAILIAIATVSVFLISQPALAEDRERDIRERTTRTRNILAAGTGALLLHLGMIFSSLFATASVRSSFLVGDEHVRFETTFAAFAPAFQVASLLSVTLGVALWTTVLLSAIPLRRRLSDAVRS